MIHVRIDCTRLIDGDTWRLARRAFAEPTTYLVGDRPSSCIRLLLGRLRLGAHMGAIGIVSSATQCVVHAGL